jgi:hypothetical protein
MKGGAIKLTKNRKALAHQYVVLVVSKRACFVKHVL